MAPRAQSPVAKVLALLPKAQTAAVAVRDYPTVRLSAPSELLPAARLLKEELGFDYLEMITAVDWLGPVEAGGYIPARTAPHPFSGKAPASPVTPAPPKLP